MSVFVDKQYISMLSPKLEKFTQKNNNLWNFRCPLCNDSRKNKNKARGYLYHKKTHISFICHNCGSSMSLGNLIKTIDPHLYSQYQLEKYKSESHSNVAKPDFSSVSGKPVFKSKKINLPTIDSLSNSHYAKKYILARKIPSEKLTDIYYTDDFKSFIDDTFPNHGKTLISSDKRIVLPFYDENNNLMGVQGRTITKSSIKYITIKVSDDTKKMYGLNKVDLTKPIYVVEGPIDSMFLNNSLATMDASLYNINKILGDYDYILVHDNEPRNPEIVKQIKKSIESKHKVCIWPKTIQQKDVNEMIMEGMSPSEVMHLIDNNTYQDLEAKLNFEAWRKV